MKQLLLSSLLLGLSLFISNASFAGNPITNQPYQVQELSGTYTSDVIIEYSNCVKVVGTVKMAPGTKIHVKSGGFLYLGAGTKITCSTDDLSNSTKTFWDGIQTDVGVGVGFNTEVLTLEGDYRGKTCAFVEQIEEEPEFLIGWWFEEGMDQNYMTDMPGVVYSDGGTIRYSRYGICAGYSIDYLKINNVLPFNQFASLPYKTNSYHYLYIQNSYFENNLIHDICMSKTANRSGWSEIINNTFSVDNKTDDMNYFQYHMSIFIHHNPFFMFPILGNDFIYDNFDDDAYPPLGIAAWDTRLNIVENTFYGAAIGVFSDRTLPSASRSYIYDNTFLRCLVGIHVGGNVEVFSNTFQVRETNLVDFGGTQIPVGIFVVGGDNIMCKANQFWSFGGWGGTLEGSIGIASRNVMGLNSLAITNNSAYNLAIFYQAEYFNHNTQVFCNSGDHFMRGDWTHATTTYGPSEGLGNQGSSNNPAENQFWGTFPSGTGYKHIWNYYGRNFSYYYNPSNARYPFESDNVTLVSTNSPRTCVNFTYAPHKGYLRCVNGGYSSSGELVLKEYYDGIHGTIDGEISNGETLRSTNLQPEYDVALASLVGNYTFLMSMDTSFNDSIYQEMRSVCMSHFSNSGIQRMFEYWLQDQNLDSMTYYKDILIDSALTDTFLVDYLQYINIVESYLEIPDSVNKQSWFNLYADTIELFAADTNNYLWSVAQTWMNLVNLDSGDKSFNDLYYFPRPLDVGDTSYGVDTVFYEFSVSPNPFHSSITVNVQDLFNSGETLEYEIISLSGTTVEEDVLNLSGDGDDDFHIGDTLSNVGYYLLRITFDGELLYAKLIYRN